VVKSRYRYLFEQLVRRELRQKYQGSALGVLWYVINPLVLMGAYALMFGVFFPQHIPDYPIFLMIGILTWTFFSQSLIAASTSLIDHSSLVRKARFPRETIPAASATVQFAIFVTVLALLAPVALIIRSSASAALLLLPLLLLTLYGFVLGASLMIAVLHAHFRDVSPIVSAALLPWFFITPIFFEPDSVPFVQRHDWMGTLLAWVNPMAPYIETIRTVLYNGTAPDAGRILYCVLVAAVTLVAARALFRRLDRELAVVV
jgi:ABC-type polysaccharide/polyol phosphate export permease